MLTQADIDRTDKRAIAALHIRSASAGYSYRGWRGRLRHFWDKHAKGIPVERKLERIINDREGYNYWDHDFSG